MAIDSRTAGIMVIDVGDPVIHRRSCHVTTDVMVVGAGPAGSVAALVLARAGVRVRVIDRSRFPRDKLCGDSVNPGTLAILDRLGVGGVVRERALPITGMTVTGPGGAKVSADYPGNVRGVTLTRRVLDMLLVEAAVKAGASVDDGVAVRGPLVSNDSSRVVGVRTATGRDRHALNARVVIAADGRGSAIAGRMGLARFARAPKRWAFGAYFTDITDMASHGEMHIRRGGYIGVAPLPDGIVNVCVVLDRANWTRPGTPSADTIALAVRNDPALRDRFARARRLSAIVALGPLAVDAAGAGCPGLLLAGDAAGFIDPMTGDGLRFAIRGGELAAQAALDELSSGLPAHTRLGSARASEFGSKWRLNRGLRMLVDSPRAVSIAAQVSRRWNAPMQVLVRLAGDVNLVSNRG